MMNTNNGLFFITLLRHGESIGNANGQIQGQSDQALTEKGRQQASDQAQKWLNEGRRYDAIIASPLLRARGTAKIFSEIMSVPVEFDKDWMERDFGDFEGRSYDEIMGQIPPIDFNLPYTPPGQSGESLVDLHLRASQALQNLLRRPAGAYLVVSHGAILNMVLYAILGISPHNSPRSPRFVFSNTAHLDLSYNPTVHQWRIYHFSSTERP